MRRLFNLPGQSCGPSGEARSTTAASHPAFSLTVAVPVRKATARPSAAGVRPASAAGPHATPHQPQACPLCSGRSGLDGLSRRPSWPVAGWAQENATSLPLSSASVCSPHGQDGSRKTGGDQPGPGVRADERDGRPAGAVVAVRAGWPVRVWIRARPGSEVGVRLAWRAISRSVPASSVRISVSRP